MNISRRLTWLTALVSGAALALACAAFLVYDQVTYRDNLVASITTQADVVGLNSVSALVFDDPDAARTSLSALATSHNVLGATIFTPDRHVFASYARNDSYRVDEAPSVPAGQTSYHEYSGSQVVVARNVEFNGKTVGVIVVRGDLSDLRHRLVQYIVIAAIVLVLSLIGALILSSAFRRAVAAPIVELANTARLISRERNYAVRAKSVASRDEVGLLVRAFNNMLDQIQQRESALDIERTRLAAIIENAPFGIVVVQADSQIITVANNYAEQILGTPLHSGTPLGLRPDVLTTTDGRLLTSEQYPVVRALAGEVVRAEEYKYLPPTADATWLRLFAAPIRDKAGSVLAAVVAFSDIGPQRKAHEALLQSEKLAAAGRLAASIAHEINNPLESVTNLLFIALADPRLDPDLRPLLRQADEELARVGHIATQTLRFYRQSTSPTKAEMGKLLDSVLQLLAAKIRNTNVRVVKDYRTAATITCFEGEMRQVFTNLISNALDATRTGRLVVRVKQLQYSHPRGGGIEIAVADTGQGIPSTLTSRIFEPFYTTKGTLGTGLGLWVSKEIIDKHSGSIRVRSKIGRGTVFVVFIPFAGAKQPSRDVQAAS